MVQTRSGRRTQAGKEAESRLRTPVSQRKTRSSRAASQRESITESQPEEQKIVEVQQTIQAELQPCAEQPGGLSERSGKNDQCSESDGTETERNDQCSESNITESKEETERIDQCSDSNITETESIDQCSDSNITETERIDQCSDSNITESKEETERNDQCSDSNITETERIDQCSDSNITETERIDQCSDSNITESKEETERNDQCSDSNITETERIDQCSDSNITESKEETERIDQCTESDGTEAERIDQCSDSNITESKEETERIDQCTESDGTEAERIDQCSESNITETERIDQCSESNITESKEETERNDQCSDGNITETESIDQCSDSNITERIDQCSDSNITERIDQCLDSNITESKEETKKEKPNETEIHEANLIEIAEVDEESDFDPGTQSASPANINLLLSSDEDKSAVGASNSDVLLEESNMAVISGPSVSTEPSAVSPDIAESPLAKGGELFVIDKQPGLDQDRKYYLDSSEKESSESEEETGDGDEEEEGDDDDFIDEDVDEEDDILKTKSSLLNLSSSIDSGLNLKELGGLYISFDPAKQGPNSKAFKKLKEQKKSDDKLLAKSILTPEIEKQESVPPLKESIRQLKKKRREERAKTTGDGWYNMKAPDLTDEMKNDLKALKMRAAINPKRFYKKNDREGFPKYFQVGRVLDNPVDFYHSRVPKKQRKQTMVEELLADAEFRRYNKRKYQQIRTEKADLADGKKHHKKKKFKN
ncbi:deoxynucleotidyltransferase terminal-interacting protein 2 [Mustelus asterias]